MPQFDFRKPPGQRRTREQRGGPKRGAASTVRPRRAHSHGAVGAGLQRLQKWFKPQFLEMIPNTQTPLQIWPEIPSGVCHNFTVLTSAKNGVKFLRFVWFKTCITKLNSGWKVCPNNSKSISRATFPYP